MAIHWGDWDGAIGRNHQMLLDNSTYQLALAHSIGGPINNNVVILLEKAEHYEERPRLPFRPKALPKLPSTKPKGLSLKRFCRARSGEGTVSVCDHAFK